MRLKAFLIGVVLWCAPLSVALACNGQAASGYACGNGAASAGFASFYPLSTLLDRGIGSTQGTILNRTNTGWVATIAPTLGVAGASQGTLGFAGATSGTATITAQAAAGSPTITLPNTTGTLADGASSPLVLNATTGNLTCPTCVTSSGGGGITGTAPINVSGAGVVSLQGATGTVATGSGGTGSSFTATPTLGVAGSTVGSIAFANLTSGSVTIQPATGGLGTAVATLPAGTYNLVGDNLTQTLTNKTLTAPVIATISNTGTLTLPTSTDTLVGRATTDTLTNKTINGSSNTLTVLAGSQLLDQVPVANGGTGQASLTANAFLTGNGTSGVNQVAITGLVLGNGASAPTQWGGAGCGTNQWLVQVSGAGAASCAQPDFANLTGGATMAQLPSGIDNNIANYYTANHTAGNSDCGDPMLLGGDVLFQLTVNAANTYSAGCHLSVVNIDSYTGSGSGRGKLIAINGITNFILYPGQSFDLFANGSSWAFKSPDATAGSLGLVWHAEHAVQFFTDTGGSDTANDGLASGASGAFATLGHCLTAAYSVVYTRNEGSVQCSNTAGQTQAPSGILQAFYPAPGGGTVIFNSATPGTAWTWDCPSGAGCLQFGDLAMIGLTDVKMVGSSTSPYLITGHNYSVLDINTNVTLQSQDSSSPVLTCDYDSHFNINNGLTVSGSAQYIFQGCSHSQWNINGTQTVSGTPTWNRYFTAQGAASMFFQGNVTFSGSPTTSAGIATGNSVVNNFAGSPFGGTPTTATGAQYCTTQC